MYWLLQLLRCYDFRFKTSRNSHIIEVNLYDEIDFICPYTPFEFNESRQEFYIVYQVRYLLHLGLWVAALYCLPFLYYNHLIFVKKINIGAKFVVLHMINFHYLKQEFETCKHFLFLPMRRIPQIGNWVHGWNRDWNRHGTSTAIPVYPVPLRRSLDDFRDWRRDWFFRTSNAFCSSCSVLTDVDKNQS